MPRHVRRTRFRKPHHGERKRGEIAGGGIILAEMEAAGSRDERRDRSVPARRTEASNHAKLSRSAGKVPQPSRDHHKKSAGDARHRSAGRTPQPSRRSGKRIGNFARSGNPKSDGAENVVAVSPP